MPLIPAPPMPTKWTRLTLCFIARRRSATQASATRSAASRRADACAPLPPSRAALARVSDCKASGEPFRRELGLRRSSAPHRHRPEIARSRSARRRSRPAAARRSRPTPTARKLGHGRSRRRGRARDRPRHSATAMSSMNATHSASTPCRRVRGAQARRRAARRPDGRHAGARRAAISASAFGTQLD